MANTLFDFARQRFLEAQINWMTDTIKAILEEADPCSRPSGRRPNRNRSYHKFIYALAHEFCANDDGRLSAKAAEKICRIVREQGDTVTIEAVGEILRDMGRAVKPNW